MDKYNANGVKISDHLRGPVSFKSNRHVGINRVRIQLIYYAYGLLLVEKFKGGCYVRFSIYRKFLGKGVDFAPGNCPEIQAVELIELYFTQITLSPFLIFRLQNTASA